LPGGALDFDFTVEGVEIGANDIEAYAAACQLGFYGSGGETGMEKHFAKIALGEASGGFRRNETALGGALFYALVVDAAAVVFDFHVDVVATVIGAERNFADFGFAGRGAIGGVFNAVGDGIADEMDERIGNLLNDVVVEFGLAAGEIEMDLFTGGLRGVADGARKT